jgi:hypothetical protein
MVLAQGAIRGQPLAQKSPGSSNDGVNLVWHSSFLAGAGGLSVAPGRL